MIVSFSLIRRRDDVPSEEFRRHWLDPHGVLAARIPGTLRYVQNHVVDGTGTNDAARALRLDGFAQLAFDSPESRKAAHASAELKQCDQDSELFIGAVSRVICDDGDVEVPDGAAEAVKQIVLTVGDEPPANVGRLLGQLEVVGIRAQAVLSQAGAPGSAVPFHGVVVSTLHEVWVAGEAAVARNATVLGREMPEAATFQVRPYVFR